MKKLVVASVFVAGVAAVAFASLNTNKKKTDTATEKKVEKKKKDCNRICPFS